MSINTDRFIREFAKEADISLNKLPKFIDKKESLIKAAISLFGFIPVDEDFRWNFAVRYRDAVLKGGLEAKHYLDSAITSIYLSKITSRHSGSLRTINTENCLQATRSFTNLSCFKTLLNAHSQIVQKGAVKIAFFTTEPIQGDRDRSGVTQCPEALYQLRLYINNKYIARIGFNLHIEQKGLNKELIASLVNIQGIPDGKKFYLSFREITKTNPFKYLVRHFKNILDSNIFRESFPYPVTIRGLANPNSQEANKAVYETTLLAMKIKRWYTKNKS